jgi:hypothetical protein
MDQVETASHTPEWAASHPAWQRLTDQLAWYSGKSAHCQRRDRALRLAQVCLAVAIPLLALITREEARWASAICGALIAVLEAVQQINQYAALRISYRGIAEQLKREKFLFLSAAGPYRSQPQGEALILLAERVEALLADEPASWIVEIRKQAGAARKTA